MCQFLVIWPGQFKRPVMYYDGFVVAKSNKLKHDRGKDNSDILGCAKVISLRAVANRLSAEYFVPEAAMPKKHLRLSTAFCF